MPGGVAGSPAARVAEAQALKAAIFSLRKSLKDGSRGLAAGVRLPWNEEDYQEGVARLRRGKPALPARRQGGAAARAPRNAGGPKARRTVAGGEVNRPARANERNPR